MTARRIVVAVTGASGAVYPRRMLALLAAARTGGLAGTPAMAELDLHWVASPNAELVWQQELGEPMPSELPGARRWSFTDFAAPFASGSNPADAVIVAPCSMSSLARVAYGGGGDLIARTCDVALKERRHLVLLARETPLSLVHLRAMTAVTEAGAIVLPAVPSFYAGVSSLEQAIDTVIVRALDRAGVNLPILRRWGDS